MKLKTAQNRIPGPNRVLEDDTNKFLPNPTERLAIIIQDLELRSMKIRSMRVFPKDNVSKGKEM